MIFEVVSEQVISYLIKKFVELYSFNEFKVYMGYGGKFWVIDCSYFYYVVGRRVMKIVFGVEVDLIREGGSIFVILIFQEVMGKNIMLLFMGLVDDGVYFQNEKFNRYNYIEGIKMLVVYFYEVFQLKDQVWFFVCYF